VDAEKKAAIRPVELDVAPDDLAIVKKGLSGGEDVVVEGQNALRPGAKVAPRAAAAASSKPSADKGGTPSGIRGGPSGSATSRGAVAPGEGSGASQ
jgi:hypothetical protein